MEFKKPNRHSRRPGQDISPRGAAPVISRPIPHPAPTAIPAQQSASPTPGDQTQKHSPSSQTRRILLSRKTLIIASIIVVAGTSFFAVKALRPETKEVATTPTYKTVLPNKKSINELGGWKRISPPEKDPVFAYADTIGDVPVSISQQPLPESFKNNTDTQVAELAKKFNATTKIDAGDTAVYIGTSAKGPQSAILAKANLLIMIKSEKKIANTAWANYAESLQ